VSFSWRMLAAEEEGRKGKMMMRKIIKNRNDDCDEAGNWERESLSPRPRASLLPIPLIFVGAEVVRVVWEGGDEVH